LNFLEIDELMPGGVFVAASVNLHSEYDFSDDRPQDSVVLSK